MVHIISQLVSEETERIDRIHVDAYLCGVDDDSAHPLCNMRLDNPELGLREVSLDMDRNTDLLDDPLFLYEPFYINVEAYSFFNTSIYREDNIADKTVENLFKRKIRFELESEGIDLYEPMCFKRTRYY